MILKYTSLLNAFDPLWISNESENNYLKLLKTT